MKDLEELKKMQGDLEHYIKPACEFYLSYEYFQKCLKKGEWRKMKYVIQNNTLTLQQFIAMLKLNKVREITRIVRGKKATIIETR